MEQIIILSCLVLSCLLLVSVFSALSFRGASEHRKLYNKKNIVAEKWAKILYCEAVEHGNPGSSYLKLSDGRVYCVWRDPSSFFRVRQTSGGAFDGTYKKVSPSISELKINGYEKYQFVEDQNKKSFTYEETTYNVSIVDTNLLGNQIKKNEDIIALIERVTDRYTEIIFKSSPISADELFLLSLMVMGEKLVMGTKN